MEKNADLDGRREPDGVREAPPEPDGEGERLADVVTDGDGVDDDDTHDVPHGDGVAVSDGNDEAQGLDERDGDAAPEVEAPGDDVDVPHCDAVALTDCDGEDDRAALDESASEVDAVALASGVREPLADAHSDADAEGLALDDGDCDTDSDDAEVPV